MKSNGTQEPKGPIEATQKFLNNPYIRWFLRAILLGLPTITFVAGTSVRVWQDFVSIAPIVDANSASIDIVTEQITEISGSLLELNAKMDVILTIIE